MPNRTKKATGNLAGKVSVLKMARKFNCQTATFEKKRVSKARRQAGKAIIQNELDRLAAEEARREMLAD